MAKRKYDLTFWMIVEAYRDAEVEIEVPDDAGPDFNPFLGKNVNDVLAEYESQLGQLDFTDESDEDQADKVQAISLQIVGTEDVVVSVVEDDGKLAPAPEEEEEEEEA